MNISDYIEFKISVADIVAIITIGFTYFSLIEIKKQRESVYLPDLFIEDRLISLYGFNMNEPFSDFTYGTVYSIEKTNMKTDLVMFLKVYNIGFGSAKGIKFKWDYDFEAFANLIEKVVDKENFDFNRVPMIGQNHISFKHKTSHHFSGRLFEEGINDELSVLRPNQTDENISVVAIPDLYSMLLSYYICFKHEVFKQKSEINFPINSLEEIPPLTLQVSYYDIGNKQRIKKFSVQFFASSWEDETGNKIKDFSTEQLLWMYQVKSKELESSLKEW